jgi:hypothetical protein
MILSVRDRPFGGFKSLSDTLCLIILSCYVDQNQYPTLISYELVANRPHQPLTTEWEIACLKPPLRHAIYVEYNFNRNPEIFFESFNIVKHRKRYHVQMQGFLELYKIGQTLGKLYRIIPCVPQE